MYFRHLYARCQPDLAQRIESWDNYSQLFGVLLSANVNMQLPNIWLWDMIDEFIYQFQVGARGIQHRHRTQLMQNPSTRRYSGFLDVHVFETCKPRVAEPPARTLAGD